MLFKQISIAVSIVGLVLAASACSKTEGRMTDYSELGYTECSSSDDCLPFSYCRMTDDGGDSGLCWADCRNVEDCRAISSELICKDFACVDPDTLVDGDADAEDDSGGECVPGTETNLSCLYIAPEACEGQGWVSNCADRYCYDNGFRYACQKVGEGECTTREPCEGKCVDMCVVDLIEGDETAADGDDPSDGEVAAGEASAWTGVWGIIFTTAARTTGLPLVPHQDTVSIHHSLVRVSQDGDDVVFLSNLCLLEMHNFKDDKVYAIGEDLAQMVVPDAYYQNLGMLKHVLKDAPALESGVEFETERWWEVRGAEIDDPTCTVKDYEQEDVCGSDLPDRAAFEGGDERVWDMDYDGFPGQTTRMVGLLPGDVYSDQRWSSRLVGTVADADHLYGVVPNTNRQYQLGASDPVLLYDTITAIHPEQSRSYFRLLRMSDNATCEDVMEQAHTPGSWLEFTVHVDDRTEP